MPVPKFIHAVVNAEQTSLFVSLSHKDLKTGESREEK